MAAKDEPMTPKMPHLPDPDQATVAACRQGDVEPFEILVKKYQEQMFNIAFRMLGSHDDAVEVVQDAFVSAYRNIKKFQGTAKFSTWLTAIVINMSKNRLKKLTAEKNRNTVSLACCHQADHGELLFDPPADAPSALERMEHKQIQQRVQWCIDRIEAGFREVLVLKDIQGFSYDEIGDVLGIPQGTVKSKLYRARNFLKVCLKKTFGDLGHVVS